eukprot:g8674.t1
MWPDPLKRGQKEEEEEEEEEEVEVEEEEESEEEEEEEEVVVVVMEEEEEDVDFTAGDIMSALWNDPEAEEAEYFEAKVLAESVGVIVKVRFIADELHDVM